MYLEGIITLVDPPGYLTRRSQLISDGPAFPLQPLVFDYAIREVHTRRPHSTVCASRHLQVFHIQQFSFSRDCLLIATFPPVA